MRNRRLVVSAALVAAGVGLVPGTAQAAGPAAPAAHGVAAPGTTADRAGGPTSETFHSAGDRTVVTPSAGAETGKGASARAQGAAGQAAPVIELDAYAVSAHKIDLVTAVTGAGADLDVTVSWGDGVTENPTASGGDHRNLVHTYAEVGAYTVTVTVKDTKNNVQAVNQIEVVTAGGEFTPVAPARLLDTRAGIGGAKAKVGGRGSVSLKIGGTGAIPAGVTAVVLNVTVTNTTEAGHIAVQPGRDYVDPETSNLNYTAGQSVPNLVIVQVKDGWVHLVNGGWAPVDLIADVTGYFTASSASGYTTLSPVRAVDTRSGLGAPKGQVAGQANLGVTVADRNGVPKGATAVALNLTVTNPKEAGHLTVYPGGQQAPSTSSVNFAAGQTVANSVIVPVGPDGKIVVRNGSWQPADVVIDVVGYYSPDSQAALWPIGPYRLIDTREDTWYRKAGPVAAREYLPLPLMGDSASPVDGWALNVTVTNTRDVGFLSVSPDPNTWPDYQKGTQVTPARPVSSSLNWTAGQTVPNLVQTSGGKGDVIDFWNQGWQSVDVVVDSLGIYQKD
ncbi:MULTISPECIES: PKD domain-containing protein [unclassified Streptomyces]|uniref:PKD domain-containing protein n=1 Tax=unclassified Streptomyces TaxID=2593676 RepID=UPI0013A68D38|nr:MULTISPECIES: PKD domain-containing protein [unclassified Streptomyces]